MALVYWGSATVIRQAIYIPTALEGLIHINASTLVIGHSF
jgi:hypothetical protein